MSTWKTGTWALALAIGVMAPRPAAAQTICTDYISALPLTITSNGTYCLTQSISSDIALGAAITVAGGSSVVIDLRGFTINNLAGGTANPSVGISAVNKQGITIRNGRLTFFRTGIALTGNPTSNRGHLIEDVEVQFVQQTGIVVDGTGIHVRGCVVRRAGSPDGAAVGISVEGSGNVLEGNLIADFVAPYGRGIDAYGEEHLVVGNRITGVPTYGLFLNNSPTTKYRDNLVNGAATSYAGGTDVGNNH